MCSPKEQTVTKEQTFFLQILSDHLNGRETQARSGLDWNKIAEYAQNHQVNGIVYHQCRGFMPAEWAAKFNEKYAAELFYYHNRVALFQQVTDRLEAARLPYFTVKGLDLARLYPIPALRTMGDCDIVMHHEDREKAHPIMLELGFRNTQKETLEWMYYKDNMEFELHDHLLYEELGNAADNRRFVDRAWDFVHPLDGCRFELDWSFHFFFLLLHLKKHLIHAGVGFRQFMDLVVVMRSQKLDWDWICRELEAQSLLRFARVILTLNERWFGEASPLGAAEMDEAAIDQAAAKVFANGIFGYDDEENEDLRLLNAITQKKGPRWLVRARNVLEFAFPPYRRMYYVPEYAFVNGRPWLLPAAWGYRFYRSVRYGMGDRGANTVKRSLVSNDKLDARERELAKWGL